MFPTFLMVERKITVGLTVSTVQSWVIDAPSEEATVRECEPSLRSGIVIGPAHAQISPPSSWQVVGPEASKAKSAEVLLVSYGGTTVNSTVPTGATGGSSWAAAPEATPMTATAEISPNTTPERRTLMVLPWTMNGHIMWTAH